MLPAAQNHWKSRNKLAASCSGLKGPRKGPQRKATPGAGCASPGTARLTPGLISNVQLWRVRAAALPSCPDAEDCTQSWQRVAGGYPTQASEQPSQAAGHCMAAGRLGQRALPGQGNLRPSDKHCHPKAGEQQPIFIPKQLSADFPGMCFSAKGHLPGHVRQV